MKVLVLTIASVLALCGGANADVSISSKPTSNMSCTSGVCTATAQKAVLNVSDLASMLASGDVAVKTGSVAKDIAIDQPLQWTSTSRLTLDAQQSVVVKKQITVAGTGALTVITNDNGQPKNKTGEFIIVPEHGSVQFWDLSSSLIIDGNSYTLVGDIKTLASDIAANPSGFYALAKPYDASVDGTYSATPVATPFMGTFEGLGNVISNVSGNEAFEGLFHQLFVSVRDLGISHAVIEAADPQNCPSYMGILSAINEVGTVENVWASGRITSHTSCVSAIGGLVGLNGGTIVGVKVDAKIIAYETYELGGLTAFNSEGSIERSFATGRISNEREWATKIGGLVGFNQEAQIIDSYSLMTVKCSHDRYMSAGGFVGENDFQWPGTIVSSYSAGRVHTTAGYAGGFAGYAVDAPDAISLSYWDTETSGQAAGCGDGDCPGLIGVTDAQLKSGLPAGFDPKVWGQSPNINNGYPYLLANPPR